MAPWTSDAVVTPSPSFSAFASILGSSAGVSEDFVSESVGDALWAAVGVGSAMVRGTAEERRDLLSVIAAAPRP